jgi:hypothetical protein
LIQDRDIRWVVRPAGDAFGPERFKWDLPELNLANHIDAVAYQGEEKAIKLAELGQAFVCFTLEEWPYSEKELRPEKVNIFHGAHSAGAAVLSRGKLLQLTVEKKPQTFAAHCDLFAARVSNPIQNDLRLPN